MPRVDDGVEQPWFTALKRGSGWSRRTVALTLTDGERWQFAADCLGPVAVHQAHRSELWAVTLVPCGRRITVVREREDAVKAAELLHRRCGGLLALEDADELLERLPGWVRTWAMGCRRQGRFVPPVEEMMGPEGSPESRAAARQAASDLKAKMERLNKPKVVIKPERLF